MQLAYDFVYRDQKGIFKSWLTANNDLWNEAVVFCKNEHAINKKYPTYNSLYKKFCKSVLYKNIVKAQAAQQTLKLVESTFKSYKALLWLYRGGKLKHQPQPPQIVDKQQTLIFTNQCCSIKNNEIYFNKTTKIKIPQSFNHAFNQIKIKHITKNIYRIIIIYQANITNPILNPNNMCAIDLGVNNLVSLVSNTDTKPRLYSGRIIKSIVHLYQQQIKGKTNKKLFALKKKQRIDDYIHKVSRDIIQHCIDNQISKIIIGHSDGWQNQPRLGKKNNLFFCRMPYSQLIEKIKYKAELAGIQVDTIEESYTSKCDYLAGELVQKHNSYLGKRIKRGLFQSSLKQVINADVNSAANIMKKYVLRNGLTVPLPTGRSHIGCLFQPIRINVLQIS